MKTLLHDLKITMILAKHFEKIAFRK